MILIPDEPDQLRDLFTPSPGDELLHVISGYASVTTLLWLAHRGDVSRIGPAQEFAMPADAPAVRLLIGMSATGCISAEDHADFQAIERASNGRIQIRYVAASKARDVHSKVYVWSGTNGTPTRAWSGSANFTMQGLGIGTGMQENVLHQVPVGNAHRYALQAWDRGLSCLAADINREVPLEHSRFARASVVAASPEQREDEPIGSEDFYLYSRSRRRSYGQGAGVNWGTRPGRAQQDEAYLAIPASVGAVDFFPEKNTPFRVVCDDGHVLTMRGASGSVRSGKDLSTWPSNASLGQYLRRRLGVASGHVITIEDLVFYGRTYVTIQRLRNGEYTLDFSPESAAADPVAEAIVGDGIGPSES